LSLKQTNQPKRPIPRLQERLVWMLSCLRKFFFFEDYSEESILVLAWLCSIFRLTDFFAFFAGTELHPPWNYSSVVYRCSTAPGWH
jgi:hypothetical protein